MAIDTNEERRGMYSTGLELLIAALVAATFGFGGVESPLTPLARALSVVLFFGFAYCLLTTALAEVRKARARERRKTGTSRLGRVPLTL